MVPWGLLIIAFSLGVFITIRLLKWGILWLIARDPEGFAPKLKTLYESTEAVVQAKRELRRKKEGL